MAEKWNVVAEPVGANPALKPASARKRKTGEKDDKGKDNVGGTVVYLERSGRREEVGRVGFIRATSENPKDSYEDKLAEMLDVAKKTAETLNGLVPDGDLQ